MPGDGDFLGVVLATVDGILVVDAGGIIRFANPAAGTVLGRTAEELGGLPFVPPQPWPDDFAELDVMRPDGTRAVVEMHVAGSRWAGEPVRVVTLRDVTVRADTQRRLQDSEERYALSARALNAGLLDWDLDTDQVYSSARLQEILGLDPVDRVEAGGWWMERVHPDDRPSFRAELDDLLEGRSSRLELECRLRAPGGPWRWVHIRALAVREDGRARRCVGSVADIGRRRRQEEELRHSALHDQLTGLANRQVFFDRLQQAIGRQQRDGRGFAVLFLDLDRFKEVNDVLGHAAGDAVLRAVARRLGGAVRATDTVARFGGDEFAVLLDNPDGLDTVVATVRRIQGALAAPLNVESRVVSTGASIGIAPGDRRQTDPEAILHQADLAMYRAKGLGRNRFEVFSPFLDTEPTARLRRHTELAEAARAGDLFVRSPRGHRGHRHPRGRTKANRDGAVLDPNSPSPERPGLGLELARARRHDDEVLLTGDRERIGHLRQLAIQRLFASGTTISGALGLIHDPQVIERLTHAMNELDATIRDIRRIIFALET